MQAASFPPPPPPPASLTRICARPLPPPLREPRRLEASAAGLRLPPPALSLPWLREPLGAEWWGRTAARPRAPEEAPALPLPELGSARRRRRGRREVAGAERRRAAAAREGNRSWRGVRRGRRRLRDQSEACALAPVGARRAGDLPPTRAPAGLTPPWRGAAVPAWAERQPGARCGLQAASSAPSAGGAAWESALL